MPIYPMGAQDRQAKAQRPAAAPTAREFAERVFKPAAEAAQKLQQRHPKVFTDGAHALYSFDGAKIHQSAIKEDDHGNSLLSPYGYSSQLRAPLPTYSPDMHQVIEHAHGRAVTAFQKLLYDHPQVHSAETYKQIYKQLFMECCAAHTIAADVARLPALYNHIYQNGGDWAPMQLR
jgi:hypothetical protein